MILILSILFFIVGFVLGWLSLDNRIGEVDEMIKENSEELFIDN